MTTLKLKLINQLSTKSISRTTIYHLIFDKNKVVRKIEQRPQNF
jgi:hypothetical protein